MKLPSTLWTFTADEDDDYLLELQNLYTQLRSYSVTRYRFRNQKSRLNVIVNCHSCVCTGLFQPLHSANKGHAHSLFVAEHGAWSSVHKNDCIFFKNCVGYTQRKGHLAVLSCLHRNRTGTNGQFPHLSREAGGTLMSWSSQHRKGQSRCRLSFCFFLSV